MSHVVLTGGTGLVGSAVLTALRDAGHQVTAVVRSEQSAAAVREAGATPAQGDITDSTWLSGVFADADGAIHTASPGDATSADFDAAVVQAALTAYSGTGKPYVHTGGVWVWGSGDAITEQDPFDAPELTAWRAGVEQKLLDDESLRGVVVAPGIVYGGGGGLVATITQPDDNGAIRLVGDGSQHWTTVHTGELADLYVRAFEKSAARGYYIGVNDDHPTVREIGEAAAKARGTDAVVAESADDSRERLFAPLVDALLLDQSAENGRARELGWTPSGPSLLDDVAAKTTRA
ncbi:NAD-dependent epimerase/dehydratase family protein [uncultured Jatrophihabitans sp.]|uniref:NAD-dependent epimerase/dehydratase family protein n=1 Tax=uncultured Jatrophihabitans sp. TaxID=1610747 RepID=UPI0035CB6272